MATFFCKDFAINTSIVIFAIKTIQSMAKVTNFSEFASDSLQISASANEKGILTKSSSNSEIELYFRKVLELSKSDNEFPINLDEVWMLVYSEKGKAVRALKENFIEGVDYNTFAKNSKTKEEVFAQNGKNPEYVDYQVSLKNGENPKGGRPTNEYKLTVSCMEFFIARKVRPVFEVYRKVFHKVANASTSTSDVVLWINAVSDSLNLNKQSKLLLFKKWGDSRDLPTPDYVDSTDILLSATELLKRNGLNISARVFNVAMIEKGFLEKCTRPSSKGQKVFNHLTTKGLAYGENQVSPSNPKETQPLYYEGKFSQLLTEVGLR